MTGYASKRAAAQDKLDDDDTQVYQDHDDALTIAYQSGYYDGKKAAQPAQEPVAYLCGPDKNGLFGLPTADKACKDCFPVYRQSPQRPWVGLTDEETALIDWESLVTKKDCVRAIEDKLKDKNNGTTP